MASALVLGISGLLRCQVSPGSRRLNCRGLLAGLASSPSLGAVMQRAADAGGPFESLRFDNLALRALPVEPGSGEGEEARRSRQVPGACFSRVRPLPVERPQVVALSAPALALLGLEASELPEQDAALYLSGCRLPAGAEPAAHCYCGHQFGSFAGQLGDGAAMYLGEVLNPQGQRWEIQLKGAGLTPYSRQADGRKVLRSSIREFLCSEAMFHLGIPTTRAGSCVTSDSKVIRDVFYNGSPKNEQCTVVLRIASTFLRFGSFEIFKSTDEYTGRKGPSVDRNDIRVKMLDYVIGTFYPEIQETHLTDRTERNAAFFKEITQRTARLVAEWQCVGFCHGVLNTDNMSIVGLTIDYGPFGFMDRYDPDHVCNGSDNMGRYTYNKQPEICKWNLGKLAEALVPELPLELSTNILEENFDATYENHYLQKMRKKLGFLQLELEDDKNIVSDFLETMYITGADFTNSFRLLSSFSADPLEIENFLQTIVEQCASLEELKLIYKPKMDPRQLSVMLMLAQSNPQLFEFIGSKANISKELECVERHSKLQKMTSDELLNENKSHWKKWLQKYSSRLEREKDGVSDVGSLHSERMKVMDTNNPKYILRNYIAQNAIDAAEDGDFAEVRRVLTLLETPFQDSECLLEQQEVESPEAENKATLAGACSSAERRPMYSSKPPPWASELCVT